jgi:hypothetical protein
MTEPIMPDGLRVGQKIFDLFEFGGQRVEPEDHPCFDPNKSTFHHNQDGSVTNTTEDLSYRMNCFSTPSLKEHFVNDEDKQAFMNANGDKFDQIRDRGFYDSEEEINDCIIYMDVKNDTDTTDHGSFTLEVNSLLHNEDFAGGRGGCSYHFTVEKNGQFGLEKEIVHHEYEQKKHSMKGHNAKGDPFDKKKRFQYICVKKFLDKDDRQKGVVLEIWAKYPEKQEFEKVQHVEDKHDWYRSPPDYTGNKVTKMTKVHPSFKDGEAITWGGPLGLIIKGGGSSDSPEELLYTFYDVKIWRPLYD